MAIYARHDLDQERQALVMHRTWELAMSGHCAGWDALVVLLHSEGNTDAERWLSAPMLRTRIGQVCDMAARGRLLALPALPSAGTASDEDIIWSLLVREVAAFWSRDFEAYAECYLQSPRFRFHAWVREEGMTLRSGWADYAARIREDMIRDPVPNPFFAFETRLESRNLSLMGDMAWCTFDTAFPTADLPGFRGPGREHAFRVLERHEGSWKIAFQGFFTLNFGQTDAPIWEIDRTGHLVWQNPAATLYLQGETDIFVRSGRLRMREQYADEKLAEAITIISGLDYGYLSRRRSIAVVTDPGNDIPATVWWVIAEHGKLTVSYNDNPLLLARLDTAARAYRLSPAQHRLAEALVCGMALPDAARHNGVRLSTAKTQLQRIFDKVGVRNQPALVRALLSVTERN